MEKFPLINEKLSAGEARRPEFGPVWLDLNTRTLRIAGSDKSVSLDQSQYQILWLLIRANGNRITQQEMIDFIYEGDADIPLSNVIDQRLYQLREKLSELTEGKVVINVQQGLGWSIEEK